jgi:hypothetical protein
MALLNEGENDQPTRFFGSLKSMPGQIKSWMEKSELTRKELERTRAEQDYQKRRIQEKQIRMLRRNYRPPGLLGTGDQPVQQGMSEKLGG